MSKYSLPVVAIGSLYRPFLEVAREAGVDVAGELARLGIRETELCESRLPPHQGRALVLRLAEKCGTRELGLVAGARAQLMDIDLVGYLARHAEHALAALEAMVRYPRLLGDTAECELMRGEGFVTLRVGLSGGRRMLPEGADYTIAVLWRLLQLLSGGVARPVEVHIARARPRRPHAYREFFGVMPVFGTEFGALRYPESSLLHPIPEHDPRLMQILEERAASASAELPSAGDWLNHVRAALGQALERGSLDLPSIAARYGLSERTVRRRLEAAGTSFRALSDDVRRLRALQLIDEGETCVATLAGGCGYTDPTAFARAFRRWTGLAPQRYVARRRPGDYPPFGLTSTSTSTSTSTRQKAPHTPRSTA